MATATRTDLKAIQGSMFNQQFRLWYQDSLGVRTPIDLTNSIVRGQVRAQYDAAVAFTFDITIADAVNGQVVVYMGGDITATMPTGPLVYDIEVASITDPTNVFKPLWGSFFLRPEVTR